MQYTRKPDNERRNLGFVCIRVAQEVRRSARTYHCARIRPDAGPTGNAAASLVSFATCWLKHQPGKNKKSPKNLLKITEIEPIHRACVLL